jgi:beta-N-acetylhexosaminidase
MAAFSGTQLPAEFASSLTLRGYAGVTLFRDHNVDSVAQVRELTAALQAAAPGGARPLLIATDQEGGQLNALGEGVGGVTEFAGAMALGATGDVELAERVARAMARELLAAGVNVDYAPVCDLATNPDNPGIGIRSFGDDPDSVARLVAATVRGLQAEGVAATAKHFPGIGDVDADTHHELAVLRATRTDLDARELIPFRAAIDAGARLVMAGHAALPSLNGDRTLPASLARPVIHDLLRDELGFRGLTITDALDMRALAQGAARIVEAIVALGAGEDLLLATPDRVQLDDLDSGLAQAATRGLVPDDGSTAERLRALRQWLAGFAQPGLDVVGSAEHRALAAELARRSVTLVRNDERLLPLRLPADARICVVQTEPADLTPADTSSRVLPSLAAAMRRRHGTVEEVTLPSDPSPSDLAGLQAKVAEYDLVIAGTVAANIFPAQAEIARQVLSSGRPTITTALRTPWDLSSYPESRTHMCTYGALSPTMEALAAALFGEVAFEGRLPVTMGDLYPRGHGRAA